MGPLYHSLKRQSDEFETLVCVTAQHRQMLDQVLRVFGIKPDLDLDLMRQGQDLFDVTASVLLGMRKVLREHRPDVLLVHGDTTTTLAAIDGRLLRGRPDGTCGGRPAHTRHERPVPGGVQSAGGQQGDALAFCATELCRRNLLASTCPMTG